MYANEIIEVELESRNWSVLGVEIEADEEDGSLIDFRIVEINGKEVAYSEKLHRSLTKEDKKQIRRAWNRKLARMREDSKDNGIYNERNDYEGNCNIGYFENLTARGF